MEKRLYNKIEDLIINNSYNDYYRREHYELKSGTKIALDYAKSRGIKIINRYK